MRANIPQDGREELTSVEWPWNLNVKIVSEKGVFSGAIVGPHHILTAANNVYNSEDSPQGAKGTLRSKNLYMVSSKKNASGVERPFRVIAVRPGTTYNSEYDWKKGRLPESMRIKNNCATTKKNGKTAKVDPKCPDFIYKDTPVQSEFSWAILITENNLESWGSLEVSRKNAADYNRAIAYAIGYDYRPTEQVPFPEPVRLMSKCSMGVNGEDMLTMKTDCVFGPGGEGGVALVEDAPETEPNNKQPIILGVYVNSTIPTGLERVAEAFNLKQSYAYFVKSGVYADILNQLLRASKDEKGRARWGDQNTYEIACSTLPAPCQLERIDATLPSPRWDAVITPASFLPQGAGVAEVPGSPANDSL